MSPEGERSSSSGEDKEKRRDSRLVRRREGREDEVAVRAHSPNADGYTHTHTHTQTL